MNNRWCRPRWSNAEGKNVIDVANSGSDSKAGSQFLPVKTINKALSVATSGDSVDFDTITGGTGGTPGTFNYVHQTSAGGDGVGAVFNITTDGYSTPRLTVYHGGCHDGIKYTSTLASAKIGGGATVNFEVESLEAKNV